MATESAPEAIGHSFDRNLWKLHCTIGHQAVIGLKLGYSVACAVPMSQTVYTYI